MSIAICFGQFGPYHHARVAALQRLLHERAGSQRSGSFVTCIPMQIAAATMTYDWVVDTELGRNESRVTFCEGLRTLCAGVEEHAFPLEVFFKARRLFQEEKVNVALLPSYSPGRYFALFAAAKSLGLRTVMMNESHAGTEQATGWKKWIKRQVVKLFDAALVGGEPHKRHFASLGIPLEKIFTGYDAVDNDFFISSVQALRVHEHNMGVTNSPVSAVGPSPVGRAESQSLRSAYGLPKRYFLSLGRMVEKKNLAVLVKAYAKYFDQSRLLGPGSGNQGPVSLVFVGTGELEGSLRNQARSLGLRVVDRCDVNAMRQVENLFLGNQKRAIKNHQHKSSTGSIAAPHKVALSHEDEHCGTVFFYGFRQIEENALFYALAEAFVLPSLKEEWGLVVNEAMASSLPVIVSRTAGCTEDLLEATSLASPVARRKEDVEAKNDEQNISKRRGRPGLDKCSNGYRFDSTSVDALATALVLIAESEQRRIEMGLRSREIVAKFGCNNFARQAMLAVEATYKRRASFQRDRLTL